jgi:hypothetical protein
LYRSAAAVADVQWLSRWLAGTQQQGNSTPIQLIKAGVLLTRKSHGSRQQHR